MSRSLSGLNIEINTMTTEQSGKGFVPHNSVHISQCIVWGVECVRRSCNACQSSYDNGHKPECSAQEGHLLEEAGLCKEEGTMQPQDVNACVQKCRERDRAFKMSRNTWPSAYSMVVAFGICFIFLHRGTFRILVYVKFHSVMVTIRIGLQLT